MTRIAYLSTFDIKKLRNMAEACRIPFAPNASRKLLATRIVARERKAGAVKSQKRGL